MYTSRGTIINDLDLVSLSETDAIGRLHLTMSQKLSEDILKAVRDFKVR